MGCPELGCQRSWDPTGGPDSDWGREGETGEIEKRLLEVVTRELEREIEISQVDRHMERQFGGDTEES